MISPIPLSCVRARNPILNRRARAIVNVQHQVDCANEIIASIAFDPSRFLRPVAHHTDANVYPRPFSFALFCTRVLKKSRCSGNALAKRRA